MQNSQAVKKCVALKSLGKKTCEIKGGSQEMATNILRFVSLLNPLNYRKRQKF